LDLNLEVDRLRFAPCLPPHWNEVALRYRYRDTFYAIAVRRMEAADDEEPGAATITVDGVAQEGSFIPLNDDRREHRVDVRILSTSARLSAECET
jgi:cyclic beta-1,2-glucan synthetase